MTRHRLRLALLAAATVCAAAFTPIIARHDRSDDDLRALGRRFADVHVEMRLPRRDGTQGPPGNGIGTLIAPRWVLTAAHVASDLPRELREPGGAPVHYVTVGGRDYRVARVFVHPDFFREESSLSDIALVQLADSVPSGRYARLYRDADETGKEVVFIGTGHSGTGLAGPTARDRALRGATNRVEQVDERRLFFTFDAPGSPTATELEGISGPGDSGNGALMERDGVLYVIGVGCCQRHSGTEGVYGVTEVYPRVSFFAPWIDEVMAAARTPMPVRKRN